MTFKNRVLSTAVVAAALMFGVGSPQVFAQGNAVAPGGSGLTTSLSSPSSTSTTRARRTVRRRTRASREATPAVNNPAAETATGDSGSAKGSPNSGVTTVPGAPAAGNISGGGSK